MHGGRHQHGSGCLRHQTHLHSRSSKPPLTPSAADSTSTPAPTVSRHSAKPSHKSSPTFNGITAYPRWVKFLSLPAPPAPCNAALLALLNPERPVHRIRAFYGYHVKHPVRRSASSPLLFPLKPSTATWTLDIDRLRAAVTPCTRAIILEFALESVGEGQYPHRTRSHRRNRHRARSLRLHRDEMYEVNFIYDGERHISIAAPFPAWPNRTITISGFSKTFSVTGWRLGYLTASARWMPAIGYFHDLTAYVCAALAATAWTVRRPAGPAASLFTMNLPSRIPSQARHDLRLHSPARASRHPSQQVPITSSPTSPRIPRRRCQTKKLRQLLRPTPASQPWRASAFFGNGG